MLKGLTGKHRYQMTEDLQNARLVLPPQAQDDQAGELFGWIRANVGGIYI